MKDETQTLLLQIKCNFTNGKEVELPPTITEVKGPLIFICHSQIFVTANIESKEKLLQETQDLFPL